MATAPVGILGGTFDPIHLGHLRLAEELAQTLRLAAVRFVPSGTPPHRAQPRTATAHRVAMVRLAVAGNPLFTVDEREARRSGPAYTFDTLTELRQELGTSTPVVLIVGADAFLDFAAWHRWHELFGLAHVAVAHRPGFPVERWRDAMPQPLAREYAARAMQQPRAVHLAAAGGIAVIPITALDISATAIRALVAGGGSPRSLLPDPVLDYIRREGLYTGG